ncbi:MAG: STAS/SEC14 domain-containing protein [Pirellulaceae bacterium]|nr:STAS/SEC14 domain-containing protein [Pirellulaceae bacterium]
MNGIEIKTVGNVIEVSATGKLTKENYEELVPAIDAHIKAHGKLHILFQMHDFHGWTAGAMWEDIKFDCKHWHDIERIAIVGESKWEAGMAMFCKPFTTAKIQYFDSSRIDEARDWIKE